jgi:hypothetical protein
MTDQLPEEALRQQRVIADEVLQELLAAELVWRDTVQVGDLVDGRDDHFYLSGPQYETKDKLYVVRQLDFRPAQKSWTVIVDADHPGERNWLGHGNLIIRDGKVIWNWYECCLSMKQETYPEYLARAAAELYSLRLHDYRCPGPDLPFLAVNLHEGRELTLSGCIGDHETPATVERVLTMSERHDVFIRLQNGRQLILMLRKEPPPA